MTFSPSMWALLGFISAAVLNVLVIGRWSGKIDQRLEHGDREIDALREAKHRQANMIQTHEAKIVSLIERVDAIHREVQGFRDEIEFVGRIDERLKNIERMLEEYRRERTYEPRG